MKILVVGGGTAGLISALILKKFLNIKIDVVYSKNIGIIGVGEGSTEHFSDFMNFLNIDQFSIIKNCDATFKSGIMFQNWSENDYFHNVSPPFSEEYSQYPYVYANLISKNSRYVNTEKFWDSKINSWFLNKNENRAFNQYHFNTHKLNQYLTNIANEMGIQTIEDEIKNVELKENGEIDYLVGEKNEYYYDFYIDSTGFKRVLMSKLNAKWTSFGKYLKMKSAIVFPTEDTEEYNLWTTAKAMDYGWRFQLPVWGRHGNGYIFDSDYINADQAKEELDKEFGFDVEISKQFNFDPGYLEKVWIKNCVAIGLSGSFVEPMEATSIGSTIQQSFLLMNRIIGYGTKEIESYNKEFSAIMNNIRDFIVLHYVTKKENSNFWKDNKYAELPDSLKNNLDMWKNRMPIKSDFTNNASIYNMFWETNFIVVMHGLGLFNIENIKREYNLFPEYVKNRAEEVLSNQKFIEQNEKFIGHKKFLELTRNYF